MNYTTISCCACVRVTFLDRLQRMTIMRTAFRLVSTPAHTNQSGKSAVTPIYEQQITCVYVWNRRNFSWLTLWKRKIWSYDMNSAAWSRPELRDDNLPARFFLVTRRLSAWSVKQHFGNMSPSSTKNIHQNWMCSVSLQTRNFTNPYFSWKAPSRISWILTLWLVTLLRKGF